MRGSKWLIASLGFALSFSTGVFAADGPHYTYQGHEISKDQYDALIIFNQSFDAMKKGDYKVASAKLEQAVHLDPKLYQARTNYGFVLSRLGRMDEAIAELQKAIELDPSRAEAVTTLAAMYQATGKLQEAIDLYSQVLQRYPKHPLAINIQSVITQLKEQKQREDEIAKSIAPEQNVNDYFEHTTYESVSKWLHMPLKVYIPPDSETSHISCYRSEFGTALRDAFKEWAEASGNAVKYQMVTSQKDADIDVLWTSDPTKVSRPSEGGEARVAYDVVHGINHAQIILLTKTPDGTEFNIPLNIIKAACLHEIGHSLGLLGHSPNANDVMFCSVPAADQPHPVTARDGATLAHLYRPDVALAHHFHESSTLSGGNDKIAYNNEGVNFASSQQFEKAIEKFEASLKLDPTYEPARQNLGACLNNVAINLAKEGKYADAAAKFKRSLELQNKTKDRDRILSVLHNYAFVLQKLNRGAEAQSITAQAEKLKNERAVTSLKSK